MVRFGMRCGSVVAAAGCAANFALHAEDSAPRTAGRPIPGLVISAETTVIAEPLNDLGFPDYVAALDLELGDGVRPEENFWIGFVEAMPVQAIGESYLEQLAQRPGFERALSAQPRLETIAGPNAAPDEYNRRIDLLQQAMAGPWTAADHPELAEWLDRNAAALDKVRAASRLPQAYAPLITGRDRYLYNVLLPHVQETRNVARTLVARARRSMAEGRLDEAWQDVLACHRIAGHLDRSPFLIERLVGFAIRAIAQDATLECLISPQLSARQIRARWSELEPLLVRETRAYTSLRAERLAGAEALLMLRSGRRSLDDMVVAAKVVGDGIEGGAWIDWSRVGKSLQSLIVQSGDVNATLRELNAHHDGIEKALREETYAARTAAVEAASRKNGAEGLPTPGQTALAFLFSGTNAIDDISRRSILSQLTAAYGSVNRAEVRVLTRTELLRAAVAAELAAREEGVEIEVGRQLLDPLRDDAAIILDPYTDEPFLVRRTADQLLIYTHGDNGVDDGGLTFGEGADADDIAVKLPRADR
ncbi:MAG: hypothetical protein KF774_18530 [Planctomyces sp.]|nr:hypothetical protein [Planctomyces sp.]